MYELAEYALVIMMAVIAGGFAFVALAAFLIIMEGFHTTNRSLQTRQSLNGVDLFSSNPAANGAQRTQ